MHDHLLKIGTFTILGSFLLKSLPYLQVFALVLGMAASLASLIYHVRKIKKD